MFFSFHSARNLFNFPIALLVVHGVLAFAADLKTNDGLVLEADAKGRAVAFRIGSTDLLTKPSESSIFAVRDYATSSVLQAEFPLVETENGVQQQGMFEQARLSFSMEGRTAAGRLEFTGEVVDERKGEDRAADVIFRLPFHAEDVVWWRDIRTPLTHADVSVKPPEERGQPHTVITFSPMVTSRLRILQPQGGGCAKAPNMLWIAEVEVFGRDQNLNILRDSAKVGVKAESTAKGYSTARLADGVRNDGWDDDWFKRGWASENTPSAKWVEFEFPGKTEVARLDIYWCLERFGYATSRAFWLEAWDGKTWAKIEPATIEKEGAPGDAEKASFEREDIAFENMIYPFACLTDVDRTAGLAVAVPPDSPCVFNMSYKPENGWLEVTFKFGLSQLPRNPKLTGRAPFRFVLYRVDPEWGFRDAARRYYEMYPEAFRVRTERHGLWLFTGEALQCPNPYDYAFHEGGPRGSEIDEIYNISTCPYILVGQRELESSARNYGEAIRDLGQLGPEKRSFYGPNLKEIIENCSLRDAKDRYLIKLRRRGGSLAGPAVVTFPVNPDPSLWEGQEKPTVASETLAYVQHVIESDPHVDGIYVDSLSSWGAYENSRREHFAYVDLPLTHDDNGNVVIWNRFAHVEFLRELGKILHPRNKIIFGNGIRNSRMWCAFDCDVHGVECGPSVYKDASHYCWFRTIAYHKPFLLLYYYNYPKMDCPREAAEEYIQSAIAYGIAPEVRPFGKFIERDLDLYEKFMPIFRKIMRAGWEPVTHAHSSDPRVWLERFGGGKEGLFFTLYNPTAEEIRVKIAMDWQTLGLPQDVKLKELVAGGEWQGNPPDLLLPPKTLRTLQVGDAPEPEPLTRMAREELVERILSLREKTPGAEGNLLDNPGFEQASGDGRPVGWGRAMSGNVEIEVVDAEAHTGKRCLYLRDSDEKGAANLTMEFSFLQPNTAYELRVWLKQTPKSKEPGRIWYQWRGGSERLRSERFDFPRSTEWTECRWALIPPDGADLLRINLGSSLPETVELYLDDIHFSRRRSGSGQK